MLRKTTGHWMINGNPVSIAEGDICDYPDSATVVEYETEEALIDAHKEANPDLYEDIPVRVEEPEGE